jgi:hypothetical protein
MTLILAVQHPDWVAIASDRLLSTRSGGVTKSTNAVKMLFFYSDMLFGYTGYAQLENEKGRVVDTDVWLANVLASVGKRSVPDAISAVHQRISLLFPRMAKYDKLYPSGHAFLGMGWSRNLDDPADTGRPMIVCISNFHDSLTNRLEHVLPHFNCIIDDFDSYSVSQSHGRILSFAIGVPAIPGESVSFKEKLMPIAAQSDHWKLLHLMKDTIRSVSARLGGMGVGSDILAGILLRQTPHKDHVSIYGPQGESGIIFYRGTEYAPRMSEQVVTGFYLGFRGERDQGIYEAAHVVAPGYSNAGFFGKAAGGDLKRGVRFKVGARNPDGGIASLISPQNIRYDDPKIEKNRAKKRRKKGR